MTKKTLKDLKTDHKTKKKTAAREYLDEHYKLPPPPTVYDLKVGDPIYEVYFNDDIGAYDVSEFRIYQFVRVAAVGDGLLQYVGTDAVLNWDCLIGLDDNPDMFATHYHACIEAKKRNQERVL